MLAAARIDKDAFGDIFEIIESQSWIRESWPALVELWGICEARDEQELLRCLLKDFCYFGSSLEKEALLAVADKVTGWGLLPDSSWVVAVANDQEIDGSQAALQKLKNKIKPIESWHARFVQSIPAAAKLVANGQAVVLFDDFIGTGDKMIKKMGWFKKIAAERGVDDLVFYFVALSGMRFGMDNIHGKTGCEIFVGNVLQKAISEKNAPGEAARLIGVMKRIESRLADRYKSKKIADYSLGYGQSEAIYCAENDNCPNNVFPVFWWPILKGGVAFNSLLRRAG